MQVSSKYSPKSMLVRILLPMLCWAFLSTDSFASIYCPMDVTIFCNDDIHNTSLTGAPVVFNHDPALVKYKDLYSGQQCYGVNVARTWYIDLNGNQSPDASEPSCVQQISIANPGGTISVLFPSDRQYGCKEDVIYESPTWIAGPCDVLGVSHTDQTFEVSDDACYKIFRKFTVINWCTYKPGTPGWNGEGIWTHTQKIKVVETSKPDILSCEEKILNTDEGCQATFSLSNLATDDSSCGEQLLYWIVEVDLWGNGSNDYVYGFNQAPPFNLAPTKNNEEIAITLPEKVGTGNHKIVWKVRDACGNYSACQQTIKVKDLKKPTPVMHQVLYASFEGPDASLKVTPEWFNVKSYDNCTDSQHLAYSFSESLTDTVRIIDCNNSGFQFFTIYVTDKNGNQEYAEVFMLVFDNGSCDTGPRLSGNITEPDGTPTAQALLSLHGGEAERVLVTTSNADGSFSWEKAALYQDSKIVPSIDEIESSRLEIADFKKIQDYLLGKQILTNFEWLAADMDGDHKIRVKDLEILKQAILKPEKRIAPAWIFAADVDTIVHEKELKDIFHSLPLVKSDGRINFKAIYNGDVSGANGSMSSPRNRTQLLMATNGDKLTLSANEDLVMEGLQIELYLPKAQNVHEVNVLGKPLNSSWYAFDRENHILRVLIQEHTEVAAGTTLLELVFESIDQHNQQITILEGSYLLQPGYILSPLYSKWPSEVDLEWVYPNPSNGICHVRSGSDIVDVIDMMGKKVPFTLHEDLLELHAIAGLYNIVFRTTEGLKSIRLLKN